MKEALQFTFHNNGLTTFCPDKINIMGIFPAAEHKHFRLPKQPAAHCAANSDMWSNFCQICISRSKGVQEFLFSITDIPVMFCFLLSGGNLLKQT